MEPVYARRGLSLRARILSRVPETAFDFALADELVTVRQGDVFVGLDLALEEIPVNAGGSSNACEIWAHTLRGGLRLLPLMRTTAFRRMLNIVPDMVDQSLDRGRWCACISRAVADDLVRSSMASASSVLVRCRWDISISAAISKKASPAGISKAEQSLIETCQGCPAS